jgi:large subunit ribosomal protein L4
MNLPKKVKKMARNYALTYKARDKKVVIVEDFKFDEPKTKKFIELLRSLKIEDGKILLITTDHDLNLYKSARNVPYANIQKSPDFSAYDVLNADVVIFQHGALEKVNEVLDNERS